MNNQFIYFQTVIPQSYQLSYQIYLPANYGIDPTVHWPLILCLHGAAARGVDPEEIRRADLPATIEAGVEYPFIIVAPLCPAETWWSDHLPALDILLKEVTDRYLVDVDRIAVTGVSMGAFGVWPLGVASPNGRDHWMALGFGFFTASWIRSSHCARRKYCLTN